MKCIQSLFFFTPGKSKEEELLTSHAVDNLKKPTYRCRMKIEQYKQYHSKNAYNNRRNRTSFTKKQLEFFEEVFLKNPYPDNEARAEISKRFHVTDTQIQVCNYFYFLETNE